MDINGELHESISRLCDVPRSQIRDDSTLADLGFDSLASAEVLTDLEIKLGRDFPVESLRALNQAHTVADVAAILQAAWAPETSAAS